MNKIKAIIFDFGGVLSVPGKIDSFCKKYAVKLNKNPEEFMKLIRKNWNSARVNKIKSELFWKRSAKFLEVDAKKFRYEMLNSFMFQEDVLKLIKKLKKEYKIGMLSDQIEDWLEGVIKERKLNKVFDVITTSYKSKITKSDINIYNETVRKLGVNSLECIYIDDLERSISNAKKLGMKTILFKNNSQLIRDLRKLGVKI